MRCCRVQFASLMLVVLLIAGTASTHLYAQAAGGGTGTTGTTAQTPFASGANGVLVDAEGVLRLFGKPRTLLQPDLPRSALAKLLIGCAANK